MNDAVALFLSETAREPDPCLPTIFITESRCPDCGALWQVRQGSRGKKWLAYHPYGHCERSGRFLPHSDTEQEARQRCREAQ